MSESTEASRPPLAAVLIGIGYAMIVGWCVALHAYAAAAGVFTYGLALGLGCIYQAIRRGQSK